MTPKVAAAREGNFLPLKAFGRLTGSDKSDLSDFVTVFDCGFAGVWCAYMIAEIAACPLSIFWAAGHSSRVIASAIVIGIGVAGKSRASCFL